VGRKFGKFGKSQAIHQTKIIQTLHYIIIIINLQFNFQCRSPNFPLPNLLRITFAKLSCYMVFTSYLRLFHDKISSAIFFLSTCLLIIIIIINIVFIKYNSTQ